jgi:hypothetical protein
MKKATADIKKNSATSILFKNKMSWMMDAKNQNQVFAPPPFRSANRAGIAA